MDRRSNVKIEGVCSLALKKTVFWIKKFLRRRPKVKRISS